MFILIHLKKIFQGSKFDRFFRIIICFFSPYYYKHTKSINLNTSTNFLYICYGGLGDTILSFPFLQNLSKKCKITIFIDQKFRGIESLLNSNIDVVLYNKIDILKELRIFVNQNKNLILIQQSPILEFILFHIFLKKPPTIGYLYRQDQISFEGFEHNKIEIQIENKLLKYNFLEKNINIILNKHNYILNNFKKTKRITHRYRNIPNQNYFILSPTKDPNWSMGFLDYKTYANFLNKMIEETDLIPVFVGTSLDQKIIENILSNVNYKNVTINLAGKTRIIDLISLICEAQFVVANDNGVHHLSNFLNKKTLTLYNFSSYQVYNWNNKNSEYIFNPMYNCMPCVGDEKGPFDNYPFKCPWNVRCKHTINEINIIKKLNQLNWI